MRPFPPYGRATFLVCAVLPLLLSACRPTESGTASVPAGDAIERGRYLATILACGDCHTPFVMTPQGPAPDPTRLLSGHPESLVMPAAPPADGTPWIWHGAATNTAFAGPWGVSFAPNITPHEVTGIGPWSEEIFVNAMRTGRHWGQSRPILPPMPWQAYSQMTDDDLKAVYAWLRTVTPIRNQAPEAIIAPPPAAP